MDLFQFSNLLVLPFWLLMIFLPHWALTKRVMESIWPVIPVALMYAILVVPGIPQLLPELMQPNAASVAAMLGQPAAATIAWIHFLAFDLFVGRWAYLDSRRREVSVWLASPALFLILMFGPLGLLVYLVVAQGWSSRFRVPEGT